VVFKAVFDMSCAVASLLFDQICVMNVLHSLHDSFPDQLLCSKFHQTHMFLKELARLIHEIVTQVLLVANTDASPKVVDQTPSDEMTGHVNGNSRSRSLGLDIVVSHRDG